MESQVVNVGGKDYTISQFSALIGVQAIGVLSKHATVIDKVLVKLTDIGEQGEGNQSTVFLEALSEAYPLLDPPEDLFRLFSMLSGIDKEVLEVSPLADLWPVVKAVWGLNNLVSLLGMVPRRKKK